MRHGDECMQRVMEAVEADDEGRTRRSLDKKVPRRPAPDIAGGGGAAPVVAAPTVRTVGRASSSSAEGSPHLGQRQRL